MLRRTFALCSVAAVWLAQQGPAKKPPAETGEKKPEKKPDRKKGQAPPKDPPKKK